MDGIVLRAAGKEDFQEIRNLMQRLAEAEGMPDGPKIDARTLEKDGFGDNPLFYAFVAEENDKIIGYTIYSFLYLTWAGKSMHLSDIYVIPEARKKGVGSLLFHAVAKKALEENCKRLNFTVLEWNPAGDFYKNRGAVDLTETEKWHVYRMDDESLRKLVINSTNS